MQPISNETELKYILQNAYFNANKEFTFSSPSGHVKFLIDDFNKRFAIVKFGDGVYFYEHYHLLNYQLSQNNEIIATGTDYIAKTTPKLTKLQSTKKGMLINILLNDFNKTSFEFILLKEYTNTNSAEYIEAKNIATTIIQSLNFFLDYKIQNELNAHYSYSIPLSIKFTNQKQVTLKTKNWPLKAYTILVTIVFIISILSQPTQYSNKTVQTPKSTIQKPTTIPTHTPTPTPTPTYIPKPIPTSTPKPPPDSAELHTAAWNIFIDLDNNYNEFMTTQEQYISDFYKQRDLRSYCRKKGDYFQIQSTQIYIMLKTHPEPYLEEMLQLVYAERDAAYAVADYLLYHSYEYLVKARESFEEVKVLRASVIEKRIDFLVANGYSKSEAKKIVNDSLSK